MAQAADLSTKTSCKGTSLSVEMLGSSQNAECAPTGREHKAHALESMEAEERAFIIAHCNTRRTKAKAAYDHEMMLVEAFQTEELARLVCAQRKRRNDAPSCLPPQYNVVSCNQHGNAVPLASRAHSNVRQAPQQTSNDVYAENWKGFPQEVKGYGKGGKTGWRSHSKKDLRSETPRRQQHAQSEQRGDEKLTSMFKGRLTSSAKQQMPQGQAPVQEPRGDEKLDSMFKGRLTSSAKQQVPQGHPLEEVQVPQGQSSEEQMSHGPGPAPEQPVW